MARRGLSAWVGAVYLVMASSVEPLPDDSDESHRRFRAIHRVLRPAFLSRAQRAENERALLGYFYREHAPEPS